MHKCSVAFYFFIVFLGPFFDAKIFYVVSIAHIVKKYFFSADYKAFNYLIEKPEESAKEILKYGDDI